MKDEFGGRIMKAFYGLRAKTYSYLKDNYDEDKKVKDRAKFVINRKLKYQDYKNSLEAAQTADSLKEFIKIDKLILKTQQRFISEMHNVFML